MGKTGVLLLAVCASVLWGEPRRPRLMTMTAMAYSIEGRQAAGTIAREGTAAADPDVLPLGTRIRVRGGHGYIGEFVITDTGADIQGRRLDIYFKSDREAKRFGRKRVRVEVLEWGEGAQSAHQEVREGLTPPRPAPPR